MWRRADDDPQRWRLELLVYVLAIGAFAVWFIANSTYHETRRTWQLWGQQPYEAPIVLHYQLTHDRCHARFQMPDGTEVSRSSSCDILGTHAKTVRVLRDPEDPEHIRLVDESGWKLWTAAGILGPLSGLLPPLLWFLRARRRAQRREGAWVAPTLKLLTDLGRSPELLDDGDILFDGGRFEYGADALRVELVDAELPVGHVSRATVLPGENLQLAVPSFDDDWRIRSDDPVRLALALGPRARDLLQRVDHIAIRDGSLQVQTSKGHTTTFLRTALELQAALREGAWAGATIPGLVRTPLGFEGEREGLRVRVELIRQVETVQTRLTIQGTGRLSAQREGLASARPTGNVVVDQLIQVDGALPQDDATIERLLELVHGHGARLVDGTLIWTERGVWIDELVERVDRGVALVCALR